VARQFGTGGLVTTDELTHLQWLTPLQRDVEGVLARVVALGQLDVVGHDLEAVWRIDASESHQVGLGGIFDGVNIGVGGDRDFAVEYRLVELRGLARLAPKVDVSRGVDAHGVFLLVRCCGCPMHRRFQDGHQRYHYI
jgi:hypothetical protein